MNAQKYQNSNVIVYSELGIAKNEGSTIARKWSQAKVFIPFSLRLCFEVQKEQESRNSCIPPYSVYSVSESAQIRPYSTEEPVRYYSEIRNSGNSGAVHVTT